MRICWGTNEQMGSRCAGRCLIQGAARRSIAGGKILEGIWWSEEALCWLPSYTKVHGKTLCCNGNLSHSHITICGQVTDVNLQKEAECVSAGKNNNKKNTVITDRVLYSLHHASCCQSIAVWFNDKLIIGQVSVNNQVYPLQLWNTELQRWQCFWSVCVNMAWQPTPRHNDQHLGVCVCVCEEERHRERIVILAPRLWGCHLSSAWLGLKLLQCLFSPPRSFLPSPIFLYQEQQLVAVVPFFL